MFTCTHCPLKFRSQAQTDLHVWLYHWTPAQRKDWVLHEDRERVAKAAASVDPFKLLYRDSD